ncbi:amine dehydrogenase large subunit [Xanthobacter sediminis]
MQQLTRCALWALALAAAAAGPAFAAEPFRPEKVTVDTVPDDVPLVFAADLAFDHLPDGRVHLFDARDFSYRGLISSGFLGLLYVPPKGDKLILATSYLDRYTRGTRSDFIEIYNPRTQALEAEISIPPRRAQAILYRPLLQGSADGKLLFVQNATPATSVTVVDLDGKKAIGTLATPGCYGIYPAATAANRFAILCGDGTAQGLTVDTATGKAAYTKSAKVFDPDKDPLFIHAERDGNTWLFVSYNGVVHRIDAEGETPKLVETFDLASGIEGGWRPGGYQPMAFDPASGILFVGLHKDGKDGSHKLPAEEIWAYDVKARKLVSRSPVKPISAFALKTVGGRTLLFGADQVDGKVVRYAVDPAKGYALSEDGEAKIGDVIGQIETR